MLPQKIIDTERLISVLTVARAHIRARDPHSTQIPVIEERLSRLFAHRRGEAR